MGGHISATDRHMQVRRPELRCSGACVAMTLGAVLSTEQARLGPGGGRRARLPHLRRDNEMSNSPSLVASRGGWVQDRRVYPGYRAKDHRYPI